ncbi:MAG: metallophosphoesterase [Pseudomonadota bacterium]
MHRSSAFGAWLVVAVGLYAAIHYYFYARLIRAPMLPASWRTGLTIALIALAVILPLSMMLARLVGWSTADALLWPAFAWSGLALFLLMALLGIDLVRGAALLGLHIAHSDLLDDPGRRLFVSRVIAIGASAVALGVSGLAFGTALAGPILRRLKVTLPRWPSALDGFSIVQLSDLHIGRTIGRRYVDDLVQRTNALKPDLIAITGDLVDGTPEDLGEAAEPLAQLRARYGVFFVPGNHDHYSGVAPWLAWLKQRHIRVLLNEHVTVGEGDASFQLAGVDDSYFGADVETAVAGHDPARELILLAHQPQEFQAAARHGVGLQLSGHTHGGQLWPGPWFARLMFRWVAGSFRVDDSLLYVHCGSGYVGPPMRLGTRSEITQFEVRRGAAELPRSVPVAEPAADQAPGSALEITARAGEQLRRKLDVH